MTTQTAKLAKGRIRNSWFAGGLLAAVLLVVAPAWGDGGLVGEGLEAAGILAITVCVLGRSYCSLFIGGRKNERVVAEGPYSVVRNPLYLFSFIGTVGIGLSLGSFTLTLALVCLFVPYYDHVVRREEGFLLARYGRDYAAYLGRVPRWIPDLRLWSSPAEVVVQPRYVLLTMRDSAFFFAAPLAFELLEYLHGSGLLPALQRLP